MLKLCVLASGSSGNCTFIGTENTRVLIDAGLSARQTARRLAEAGEDVENIDAICVSHEHGDHIAGIRVLQKQHGMPVYANGGTREALLHYKRCGEIECRQFTTGSGFEIGDLTIEPFSVPHDAYDPVGFVVCSGEHSIGVAMDMGMVTNLVREKLRQCNGVVIEANHDEALLHEADRPWSLKQRISGRQGHLSNHAAAALVAEIAADGLAHLFLAHLSSDCNSPRHARTTFETVLAEAGHTHVSVRMTAAECVSEILILE